jgi:hypothetical protein
MLCSCLLLMVLGLIQTSVEKFLLCVTLNLRLAPANSCATVISLLHTVLRTCTRRFPYSRNLESIFRPRFLFGNRQGVQLMDSYRIHPLGDYQDIKVRTALPISSFPPFSMNRVPCSIYSYPLPTVPEFLLQCCTPTRGSHQRSAF